MFGTRRFRGLLYFEIFLVLRALTKQHTCQRRVSGCLHSIAEELDSLTRGVNDDSPSNAEYRHQADRRRCVFRVLADALGRRQSLAFIAFASFESAYLAIHETSRLSVNAEWGVPPVAY